MNYSIISKRIRVVSPKFYTARKNFTGPPVPTVLTNFKSAHNDQSYNNHLHALNMIVGYIQQQVDLTKMLVHHHPRCCDGEIGYSKSIVMSTLEHVSYIHSKFPYTTFAQHLKWGAHQIIQICLNMITFTKVLMHFLLVSTVCETSLNNNRRIGQHWC